MARMKKGKFFAVSNAHLDTQWNWTIVDTIRDSLPNTLDYNFRLFRRYPAYRFNFEGAFRYKLMREYYPEKYKTMKKYVKAGRWNPVGSAWDAMDVNVPSGEALIRQILLGNNYFEKEFGLTSKDIFLPDCFGFRASLPSIEAHMGLIGFSTQKLVWGAGSPLLSPDGKVLPPMPHSDLPRMDLGRWIGPDGKGVFVSLLEGNYTYNFDSKGDERPIGDREEIRKAIEHNEKYAGVARRSMYYGTGDYGGAPSDGSARLLNDAVNAQNGDYEVIVASPVDVYEGLTKKEIEALPVYEGGLLIPHGYGAMTSHTAMKRLNRRNETLADRTERAASAAEYLTGEPYPAKRLDEGWKTFLWHQFHDDLTGTSIAPAYVFSHNDELLASNIFAGELKNALAAVEKKIDTRGKGTPYLVFNPSAFTRRCVLRLPFDGENACVYNGKTRLLTATEDGYAVCSAELAPCSFTVLHLRDEKHRTAAGMKIGKTILENDRVVVRVNANGEVRSIFDKRLQKELLSAPIAFEIYGDHSTVWPSWEYVFEDLRKRPKNLQKGAQIELIDRRPVWVGMKIVKKYGQSEFETVVKLESGSARVLFENRVHWFERASNLFVRFPLSARNDQTLFDSDPGAVPGGITDSYPYFMHNVHVWADQKDVSGTFGVLVSNDCKYGMIKKDDSTLSLALIHTPKEAYLPASGQDFQDFGLNIFSFALEGYASDRTEALRGAEALNNPTALLRADAHKGTLKGGSFLTLESEGVALCAVKKEEKGDKLIVRVKETEGCSHKGLRVGTPQTELLDLELCNGYETPEKKLPHGKNGFSFDLGKYEMKTFALTLRRKRSVKKTFPVELPKNGAIFTERGEKAAKKGVYLPKELLETKVSCNGVTFVLGSEKENATFCQGQQIALPEGATLHLLAGATKQGKTFTFRLDDRKVERSVPSFSEPVGSIESVVSGTINRVTKEPVGVVYTHTHDEKGEDRLYSFGYLFDVTMPLEGAKTLTLPKDKDLILFAAAVSDKTDAELFADVFDDYGVGKAGVLHELKTENCSGAGNYPEGALVRVFAPMITETGLFTGFEGEGIVEEDGQLAIVRMTDRDLAVRASYEKLGKDLAAGKPAKANHEMNAHERAENAVDGKADTKWCGVCDEKGVCTLTVDLGKAQSISSYLVVHAGASESKLWNTFDFEILTKEKENDPWVLADRVSGNRADYTKRSFEKRKARYVQLRITKPSRDGDRHARIYSFRIFA